MAIGDLPSSVLEAAGLGSAVAEAVGRGERVWIVRREDQSLVLRRCADDSPGWLHAVLDGLAARFPVPRPLRVFSGRSQLVGAAGTWEALSYLPGEEIGFDDDPSLEEVGAFLAAFHEVAATTTGGTTPRANGLRLDQLAGLVDWDGAAVTMGSPEGVDQLKALLERFVVDVDEVGYTELPHCFVHGDPTTFNVLAHGDPLQPSGLIDFELADVEPVVADIGFCLWRSGRPAQAAQELDLTKVRALLTGYRSVRDLTDQELAAIALCVRGRGLQMLVKRTRLAVPDDGPLAQVRWLAGHEHEVTESMRRGLSSRHGR